MTDLALVTNRDVDDREEKLLRIRPFAPVLVIVPLPIPDAGRRFELVVGF